MASKMATLEDLYTDLLKDLYSAEKQLVKALPKMAKNAQSPDLQKAFQEHLRQTEGQVERIERIFSDMEGSPRGKKCVGMEGLIEEGSEMIEEEGDEEVIDAGLISAAQRVEHYEIAAYGSVMAWAKALGHKDIAALLDETLEEEKAADKKLSALAERSVNRQALDGGNGAAAERASERPTGKQAAGTGRRPDEADWPGDRHRTYDRRLGPGGHGRLPTDRPLPPRGRPDLHVRPAGDRPPPGRPAQDRPSQRAAHRGVRERVPGLPRRRLR